MSKTRIYFAWILAFAIFLLASQLFDTPIESTSVTEPYAPVAEERIPASTEPPTFEETAATMPASTEYDYSEEPIVKCGLVQESGALHYYNEDGTLFTGGIKELVYEDTSDYYYFLSNGNAFTSGYKEVVLEDVACYYFFDRSGKAFTNGLLDVTFGSESYSYFFGEDGKAVTSGWATQDGAKYYFQENGRAVKGTFLTVDAHRYYFDEEGRVVTGWFCIDNKYYYHADENGALSANTIVDQYRLDKYGRSRTKYQILQYVDEITDESMTDQEKIDALYYWLCDSYIYYFNSYEHIQAGWNWPDGWIDVFAANMMANYYGNCFKYAAFLGLMIREATDLPVSIYHGQLPMGDPHGWVAVYQDGAWYAYDVQQATQGESSELCYKVPYPAKHLIEGIGTPLQ